MRRLIIVLSLMLTLIQVQSAAACSMVFPTLAIQTEMADVVAIGTVTISEENVATVEIEEYLKGTGDDTLAVLNRSLQINADCSAGLSADDKGFRFEQGTRLLMFLKQTSFTLGADWQEVMPGTLSILPITDETLQFPAENGSMQTQNLADVRTTISTTAATLPTPTPFPADQAAPTVAPGDPIAPPLLPATAAPFFEPTPTPFGATSASDAANAEPAPWVRSTLPWILIAVGLLAGLAALWGWQRQRRGV